MSANNGVIRIGRKGLKKFAFGEDGAPFEVDVVVAFQEWIGIDDGFRPVEADEEGERSIPTERMPEYHQAAVEFVEALSGLRVAGNDDPLQRPKEQDNKITVAEALDFIARLREQYDELAAFFLPKSREKPASPATSGVEQRFSEEAS